MHYLQPHLPSIAAPIVVSHSEAEAAGRCSFQHQLAYRERWTRKFNPDSAAGKGIAWHEVLETHYGVIQRAQQEQENIGRPWWTFDQMNTLEIARLAVQPLIDGFEDISEELGELLSWMYAGYVRMWGADPDWRILHVERAGQVPLSPAVAQELPSLTGAATAADDFHFKYRADLIIEENGRLWLVDHKSVGNFPSQMDLDFDSQVDRYTWALQQEGVPIFGAIFSQARRKILKRAQNLEERHRRPRTHRTGPELAKIAADLFLTVYERYAQQAWLEKFSVHPEVAPRDAPRQTSSRHCSFLCDFTEACLAGRKGNDSRQYLVEESFQQDFTRH